MVNSNEKPDITELNLPALSLKKVISDQAVAVKIKRVARIKNYVFEIPQQLSDLYKLTDDDVAEVFHAVINDKKSVIIGFILEKKE